MENPPKKYFRLQPGGEVRLRYAYLLTCKEVVKNDAGEVVKLVCAIDPESRGGNAPDGRKVKGTIHWVDASQNAEIEAHLYDRLFTKADMGDIEEGRDFKDYLNPDSLTVQKAFAEVSVRELDSKTPIQFERVAYFIADSVSSSPEHPVFNRTVTLKDSFNK
jgi:glutaminyl-tRNA synthetase